MTAAPFHFMGERLLRAALDHAGDVVHVTGIWDQAPAALERIAAQLPGVKRAASAEAVIEGAHLATIEQASETTALIAENATP